MKKNYFMLAAATMMFAACAETDLVNEVNMEEAPKAIEFETFAQKATRAVNSSATTYNTTLESHHTTFTVWGYKNLSNTKVFDNVGVSYSTTWDYTTPVYWDKVATTYDFYAVAPTKTNNFWTLNVNTENNHTDDYITTNEFEITSHNAATYQVATSPTLSFKDKSVEDLMIAEDKQVTKIVGQVITDAVSLNFIHILSRLNVIVQSTIDNVTITGITVGNIKSKGSFNENPTKEVEGVITPLLTAEALKNGTYSRWTLDEGQDDTPAPTVTYTNTTTKLLTKNTPVLAIEALVIPQLASTETIALGTNDFTNIVQPYLYIEYKINNEAYTQAFNLADTFNGESTNNVAFNEGWQNTLTLTIGGAKISFAGNVSEWATTSGSQDIQ